jgi:putative ABC transport system permease protein
MGWSRFLNRAKSDRERHEEIESYVQIETDTNIARGMPPAAAYQAARKKLGNPTLIREEIYRMNTVGFIDTLSRDIRHTLRALRHNPTFAVLAVLMLGLGIGASTAIFSVVNGVLIKPLPYPQADALVGVWHSAVFQGQTMNDLNLSPSMYVGYQKYAQSFQEFGVWSNGAATLTNTGDPEQVRTVQVTFGVLPALNVRPYLGRWFSQADDTPGTPETVILSHAFWQRKFAGDPQAVGRTIMIDSRPRQVIGVMPQGFQFLNLELDVILPQRFEKSQLRPDVFNYFGIARLKPGVTVTQANLDSARALKVWAAADGTQGMLDALRLAPALRLLKEDVVGDISNVLWVLMGAVGLVLLLACANVANLLLVRVQARRQELAIRAALGAGWRRIARELLVESTVLGALGGAFGLGLAYAGLQLLVTRGPADLPRLQEISIDTSVLMFALVCSLGSSILFGLIPVFKYAGSPKASALHGALSGGGRGASQSREQHRSQNVLVVTQVALALVLLLASGLMIRTFVALRTVDPGFTGPEQVQTMRISIPELEEVERVIQIQSAIVDRVAAIPGVQSVAFATALPLELEYRNANVVAVENLTPKNGTPPFRRSKVISPGLFKVQGTPLIAGRDFTWTDVFERREVAIVSRSMAVEIWGSTQAALGKRIRNGVGAAWREVVGVVGDVHDDGVNQKAPPEVYWHAGVEMRDGSSSVRRAMTFAIRSKRTGTESFLREIRQAVWDVNPDLALAQVRTLNDVYRLSLARTSFTLILLGIAGGLALLLGIVGIYGVLDYTVAQSRREVGIRIALGAQPWAVKGMFVRRGLVMAVIGILLGLGAAAGLSRFMASLLFGVTPLDPVTFAAVAVVLALAVVTASYLPARRAAGVDPIEALKAE